MVKFYDSNLKVSLQLIAGKGDLLVHINVWTPQTISSDEKKFFEKAQSSKNFQPQPTKNDKSFFDRVKEMFG